MPADDDELARITARTLADYDASAEAFWEGTRDHDVRQNIATLLRHLQGVAPFALLDLGCGPGRDLATFAGLGHEAIGVDGSSRFMTMARAHSGCEVWQQNLLALALPPGRFDGIFANAVLQHVPASELPRVLRELHAALRRGGVLFSSIPHGQGEEGWNRSRYGVYHEPGTWQRLLAEAGFLELEHYYRPEGLPREQQRWFAGAWRRIDGAAR
ncbi:MAG: class I SAM-dependent methyltransferase [Burkholderiales bacterium]|nr:class I SAM-dependent methyltransferase [Burkholderiales bacterium]